MIHGSIVIVVLYTNVFINYKSASTVIGVVVGVAGVVISVLGVVVSVVGVVVGFLGVVISTVVGVVVGVAVVVSIVGVVISVSSAVISVSFTFTPDYVCLCGVVCIIVALDFFLGEINAIYHVKYSVC